MRRKMTFKVERALSERYFLIEKLPVSRHMAANRVSASVIRYLEGKRSMACCGCQREAEFKTEPVHVHDTMDAQAGIFQALTRFE